MTLFHNLTPCLYDKTNIHITQIFLIKIGKIKVSLNSNVSIGKQRYHTVVYEKKGALHCEVHLLVSVPDICVSLKQRPVPW